VLAESTPAERHAPIFGTYSSLIYDAKETGDIGGTELTVIPQYVTAYVLFQCGEGDASPPVLVPAKATANTVDFIVPDLANDMCPGSYHGVLTARDFVGLTTLVSSWCRAAPTTGHDRQAARHFSPV
jgi:hypothetical protein